MGCSHVKRMGVFAVPFVVKKELLISLRVLSPKRFTVGASAFSFQDIEKKKY